MSSTYNRYTIRTSLFKGTQIKVEVNDNYWDWSDYVFIPVGGGAFHSYSTEAAQRVSLAFKGLEAQLPNLEAPAVYRIECDDVWGKNPRLIRREKRS